MSGQTTSIPNFPWVGEVGVKSFPHSEKTYNVADYGAKGDAVELCTEAIQKAIDASAANGGGTVTFDPGIYLTGSVFVKDNVILNIPKGAMLIGSQKITDYKRIDTRIAGIEMNWLTAYNTSKLPAGYIKWAKDWTFEEFSVKTPNKEKVTISDCSNIKINN